jgi:hypothetical protein
LTSTCRFMVRFCLKMPASAHAILPIVEWRIILKGMAFLVVTALLAFPHIAFSQTGLAPGTDFPQAQPVLKMLRAVEIGDVEGLINCYTAKAKESLAAKYGKGQLLDIHRQLFIILQTYPFKTEDFSFTYRPIDSGSGRIDYYHKGGKVKNAGSRVRLEDGEWKLEE